MTSKVFEICIALLGIGFIVFFCVTVVPALAQNFDILGAFAAGFVNPYSSGYAADVIICWLILAVWILYERTRLNVRYGWMCIVLGVVPGVAVGFAGYLILRSRQISASKSSFGDLE